MAAIPETSSDKTGYVPPADHASPPSPNGPLDKSANESPPPTPGTISKSPATKTNAGASNATAVPAGESGSAKQAQKDALVSEFDKGVSGLLANLASDLLNLKTRQQALLQIENGKPAEKVPDEKKAPEVISVPKITPDEWVHLFETTGLCQAYDLESDQPTPAGFPLFVVQHGRKDTWKDDDGEPHPVPERPVFVVDDKIRTVTEETFTKRRKYLVESGFSSAELAVEVPYVRASVQSSKSEKEQAQQASKTVYVTTRDEYPRCQLNITASVHSGYLGINPLFLKEVQEVTCGEIQQYNERKGKVKRLKSAVAEILLETPLATILKKYEGDLRELARKIFLAQLYSEEEFEKHSLQVKLNCRIEAVLAILIEHYGRCYGWFGLSALPISDRPGTEKASSGGGESSRSGTAGSEEAPPLAGQTTEHQRDEEMLKLQQTYRILDTVLREEQSKIEQEREKIVVKMQDIIVRFGAVWIEKITLGGQHVSTNKAGSVENTSSRGTTRTTSASLAGQKAGAALRLSASARKAKLAEASMSENSRSSEVHAIGGDTITFQADNRSDWVHSIRATQNWRIISYRKIQKLSTAPGLDIPVSPPCKQLVDGDGKKITVRRLLRERLNVLAEDVAELEAKKDPPRRYLGHNLRLDLKGYWYGFDCALHEGAFNPAPSILQLRVNQTFEFDVIGKKQTPGTPGLRDSRDRDSVSTGLAKTIWETSSASRVTF